MPAQIPSLSLLDESDLFSLTLWRSENCWTAGIQTHAGAPVQYKTGKTPSEAIAALLLPALPPLPY